MVRNLRQGADPAGFRPVGLARRQPLNTLKGRRRRSPLNGSVQVDAAGQFRSHLRRKGAANPRADRPRESADRGLTNHPRCRHHGVKATVSRPRMIPRRCDHRRDRNPARGQNPGQDRFRRSRAIGVFGSDPRRESKPGSRDSPTSSISALSAEQTCKARQLGRPTKTAGARTGQIKRHAGPASAETRHATRRGD